MMKFNFGKIISSPLHRMYNSYLNHWFVTDGFERINGVIFGSLFLSIFEFELDSLNILLSKFIIFLIEEPKTNKQTNTVRVDSKLKNWDNYENFRSLAGFKSKHVVLGPSKIAA